MMREEEKLAELRRAKRGRRARRDHPHRARDERGRRCVRRSDERVDDDARGADQLGQEGGVARRVVLSDAREEGGDARAGALGAHVDGEREREAEERGERPRRGDAIAPLAERDLDDAEERRHDAGEHGRVSGERREWRAPASVRSRELASR